MVLSSSAIPSILYLDEASFFSKSTLLKSEISIFIIYLSKVLFTSGLFLVLFT